MNTNIQGDFQICIIVPLTATVPSVSKKNLKYNLAYIFTFRRLCGTSKGFMKAVKVFIKPFEVRQRSVKIKI